MTCPIESLPASCHEHWDVESLCAMSGCAECTAEPSKGILWHLACPPPDNQASIRLAQKMGATPRGLERGMFMLDEESADRFAEEHPELVDDTVREMAALFGAEPEKLLGRTLVFDIPYRGERR